MKYEPFLIDALVTILFIILALGCLRFYADMPQAEAVPNWMLFLGIVLFVIVFWVWEWVRRKNL